VGQALTYRKVGRIQKSGDEMTCVLGRKLPWRLLALGSQCKVLEGGKKWVLDGGTRQEISANFTQVGQGLGDEEGGRQTRGDGVPRYKPIWRRVEIGLITESKWSLAKENVPNVGEGGTAMILRKPPTEPRVSFKGGLLAFQEEGVGATTGERSETTKRG